MKRLYLIPLGISLLIIGAAFGAVINVSNQEANADAPGWHKPKSKAKLTTPPRTEPDPSRDQSAQPRLKSPVESSEQIGAFTTVTPFGSLRFQAVENTELKAPFTGSVENRDGCVVFEGSGQPQTFILCGVNSENKGNYEYGDTIARTTSQEFNVSYLTGDHDDWVIASPSKEQLIVLFGESLKD